MRSRKMAWTAGFGVVMLAAWTLMAQQPKKVDDAALKDAAKNPGEWLDYNLGWSEQRYSSLNQIDATNVSRLGLAWYYDIPSIAGNDGGRQEGDHGSGRNYRLTHSRCGCSFRGSKVLSGMREVHPAQQQILSGMRQATRIKISSPCTESNG